MNTMAPTRPIELHACRVRMAAGPAAVAEARSQVRAAIRAWHIPVDLDVAILLTSDLVTNAIWHEAGETVTLSVRCGRGQLRIDVYGSPCSAPAGTPARAETRQGLILVASLSDEWGFYSTPAGDAVYFTLTFETDPAEDGGRCPG